ncbi:MAG TPA: cation:proton antiporter, partial [Albitalea sp.]|nr:cation:proton antiporter [Albitalea sp.]
MSPFDLSVLFFLQMAVILAACRLSGWVFSHFGQPQVVSEMIAGVLLGPSLLGWLSPQLSAALFPPESRPILFSVCQIGLVLYMFLVGAEFDTGLIRSRLRSAALVSAAGIVVPFVLGVALAAVVAGDPTLFSARTTRTQAMLFLGAAMSITAFPMLARIVLEQGLTRTSLGTLVLAAGSMDDVCAWCVLAVVLASFQSEPWLAVQAIGGGLLFAVLCLVVLKRLLEPLGRKVEREGRMGPDMLAFVLLLAMLGAWFTDTIQVYAVFGAFLTGLAMPRGRFTQELVRQVLPLTTAFLLPVFFVYSGLNTKIGLVDSAGLWLLTGVVIAAATLGKGAGCYAAARLSGEPQREALAIGALMNSRGLMELIILNIGLQRGLIEPALFTIMVVMAIVTTLMATPLFKRVYATRGTGTTPNMPTE